MTDLAGKFILPIACPVATGLVAAVASFLRDQASFIDESSQFGEPARIFA